MSIEIRVPPLGESVVEATVGRWTKQEGESVSKDEILVELETDKITVEVAAQKDGVVGSIAKQEGETVGVDDVLGTLEEGEGAPPKKEAEPKEERQPAGAATEKDDAAEGKAGGSTSPSARRLAAEHDIDLSTVTGSGPRGRITKEDVEQAVSGDGKKAEQQPAGEPAKAPADRKAAQAPGAKQPDTGRADRETRERMSRRRQTIARRLVEAQQTTASLTTFNEVDLTRVMEIRKRRKDAFHEKHGVKLGFMSFFAKAAIGALKQFPRVNAEIQGDEMVLKHYYDIGIAVGTDQGLVVPVVRDADRLSFAGVEQAIIDLAVKARDGKLSLDDLQGGTFTITNGGIYGSMLSTPILNPPQVGILGMHNITQRPMVVDGEVKVRPMMYLALTYDHRIVDGQEAVQFLVAIKRMLEEPEELLLEG